MLKLRLKCPFCGHGERIIALIMILTIPICFLAIKTGLISFSMQGFLLCMLIPAAVIAITAHLLLYRETKADHILRSSIEPPEWREVMSWEKRKAAENSVPDLIWYILAILFEVLFAIMLLVMTGWEPFTLLGASIAFTFIILIFKLVCHNHWKNIDCTAKCAVYPVYRTFSVRKTRKHGTTYKYYYEVYTPEGKLILPKTGKNSQKHRALLDLSNEKVVTPTEVTEIHIIEYKGMYTYVEYDPSSLDCYE